MTEPGLHSEVDTELARQQAAALYSLYEHKAKSLRRSLIGMAGLMTVVFGLIFWPYTTFRGEEYALERRLPGLESDLAERARDEARFEEARSYFQDEYTAIISALSGAARSPRLFPARASKHSRYRARAHRERTRGSSLAGR